MTFMVIKSKAMEESGKIYYVYIVTNKNRTSFYTGVTNNLRARLSEHWDNRGRFATFAGRYFCFNLVYIETFEFIQKAIDRETEIKKWNRNKKEALIKLQNPDWYFLNEKICGQWPPTNNPKRF
jgi:putative endonuclease